MIQIFYRVRDNIPIYAFFKDASIVDLRMADDIPPQNGSGMRSWCSNDLLTNIDKYW